MVSAIRWLGDLSLIQFRVSREAVEMQPCYVGFNCLAKTSVRLHLGSYMYVSRHSHYLHTYIFTLVVVVIILVSNSISSSSSDSCSASNSSGRK